jgi:curved DNA-binding protein CbpA
MDPQLRQHIEIETTHELLGDLTHYQLLKLGPDVGQSDIGPAYRLEARRLHPDRFVGLKDALLKRKVTQIYKAVTDAWKVLKEPNERQLYDASLRGEKAREEAEAAQAKDDPLHAAKTEKGSKYWKMALSNWKKGDFSGAVMQIKFAMTFEPDNPVFVEWLEKSQAATDEAAKENHNPYKLRIV